MHGCILSYLSRDFKMLKNKIQSSYCLVVKDIILSLWTKACVVTIQVGNLFD